MSEYPVALRRRPRRPLAGAFPWPFVGTAVILSTLVVLTPVLFTNGGLAGSFLTAADLIVDRVAGNNSTHFYVRGVDSTVRYKEIEVGIATGFNWSDLTPTSGWPTNWTWTDLSDVLEVALNSTADTIAINVTVLFSNGGTIVNYAGIVAIDVSGTDPGTTLSLLVSHRTSGMYAPSTLNLGQLPEPLALQNFGSGSPP